MPSEIVYKPSIKSSEISKIARIKEDKYKFHQGLLKFGKLKGGSNYVTGGTTTIYTCPQEYEFYLFNIVHQIITESVNLGDTVYYIKDQIVSRLRASGIDKDHEEITISFTNPIKLIGGNTIKIFSDANFKCVGSYIGYEIKREDVVKFLEKKAI